MSETLKRIEQYGDEFAMNHSHDIISKSQCFQAGAISERNKVLEHIQAQMEEYRTENYGFNGSMMFIKDVIAYLESLKIPTKMKDKQTYKEWELIHDNERSLVTLVLNSEEGVEKLCLDYDELATLKVLLGAVPLSPNLPS